MSPNTEDTDRISYQTWQHVEQTVGKALDRTPSFWKYVLSAYQYYRSRLNVPGRAYDSDEYGMLAIGGSAHADIMDLEVFMAAQSDQTKAEAYEWTQGSSQEKVAYWRGMGRGGSQQTVSRKRSQLAEAANAAIGE